MADSQTNDNSTCVVCFKNVLFYSIGECDHPVCYECSTRMRVLCLQNECPICRQGLSRVVFTDSIQPYKELRNKVFLDRLFERQFKIGFCSEEIKQAYEKLLENQCRLCDKLPPFRTFSALSDHMRKVHERFYCDLCVKHLKIFTSERKSYNRQELAHHRRKGDVDDTSHRGHPLCEFCEERFMDADELYRHLRKEHLYCHLCDADGKNLYYATHAALAHHFRSDHYLCEEGECAGQHLTAVFRTEIDLKAHKASVHGKGLARAAARQARTLELQFNITPHPVAQRVPRSELNSVQQSVSPTSPAPAPPQSIDTGSVEQFPRLSATGPAPLLLSATGRTYKDRGGDGLSRTDRNFPALDGNASRPAPALTPRNTAPAPVAATILRNSKPSVSIQLHSQPTSASNFRLTQTSGNRISIPQQQKKPQHLSDDDFPSLSMGKDDHPSIGAGSLQPPKVTLINSQEMQSLKSSHSSPHHKKPQLSSEAFPALSSASAPTAPPQWITVTKSKDKNKAPKPEPPPKQELAFNPTADFPTLPINAPKAKPKKTPPPQPTSSQNDNTNKLNSKKDKKKQNNNVKKDNYVDFNNINGVINDKRNIRDSMAIDNNNQYTSVADSKIKTVADSSPTCVNTERHKHCGNGEFSIKVKEYPPLNAKNETSRPTSKMVNGAANSGFAAKARPTCDGMTFTNSSGETFPAPVHTYIQPLNFESRNRELVKKFAIALGGAEAVEDFKVASRAFRDSIISADEFYQHCESALGPQLESVFPELVALLPDIGKQQELVVGRPARAQLVVCKTCGQLLSPDDSLAHETEHWPPLASR